MSETQGSLNHLLTIHTGDGVRSNSLLNQIQGESNMNNTSSVKYGGTEQLYSQGENAWSFANHPLMGMVSFHHNFRYPYEVELNVLNMNLKSSGLQWDVQGETNYDANTMSMSVSRRDLNGFEKFSSHVLGNYDISSIPYSWYVSFFCIEYSILILIDFLFLFFSSFFSGLLICMTGMLWLMVLNS
jgi:hypothetical protein